MHGKIRVMVLFGGRSAEHEVSLQSAKNLVQAIDKTKYELVLIGIDKTGRWFLCEEGDFLIDEDNPRAIRLKPSDDPVVPVPWQSGQSLVNLRTGQSLGAVDVVFPILHGPYGEDGTVQGLLKLADVPFVGAGVLGSAIGMDKDVSKRLLRDAGIPVAKFVSFQDNQKTAINYDEIVKVLGLPLFVKPTNLGSSVGISKVTGASQFTDAVRLAFKYDVKILVEEYIKGREIECAVLGNEEPIASIPGEIIAQHDFYSYEAKYIDERGAILESPAKLPPRLVAHVQRMAIEVFQLLCCEGMARVDFFLQEDGKLIVNEINTIPGFTQISMYPKLFSLTGIPYPQLIDRLIQLAMSRHETIKNLKTSF